MKQLEVILKTVERCNINCSYCYMFNMGDKTFKDRPAYMSEKVALKTVGFLKDGCIDLGINSLILSFHGGEPLMQKKSSFEYFCELFYKELSDIVDINLQLHTNAMLIDDEWINLFYKYNVGVGVSIDGIKKYHDIYRKDKRGNGTYDRVVKGIKKLSENKLIKKMGNYGLLCVIDPNHDAKEIYRYFVDDLHAKCIDFLLPHCNHDTLPPFSVILYGKYLVTIFNEWIKDDNPDIYIRIISSVMEMMIGGNSHYMYGVGLGNNQQIPIISINSDGGVTPTDEFRTMSNDMIYTDSYVDSISLKEFLCLPLFQKFNFASNNLPKVCKECDWKTICNAGSIVNRFSVKNGFDNASVYCDALKIFYEGILTYLEKNIPAHQYQLINNMVTKLRPKHISENSKMSL